jgi:CHAT domain-containing protein
MLFPSCREADKHLSPAQNPAPVLDNLVDQEFYSKAIRYYDSDNEASENNLKRALQLYNQNFGYYYPGTAKCYGALGKLYLNTEEYEKALTCFLNARKILLHLFNNMHPDLAYNSLGLGATYHQLKELNKSKFYFLNALDILSNSEKEDIPTSSEIYIELAKVYLELHQYEPAMLCCNKSMQIEKKLGDVHSTRNADAYACLANIEAVQQHDTKALQYYTTSNQLYKKIFHGKNHYSATVYLELSNVYLTRNEYAIALQYADSAVEYCQQRTVIINYYDHWRASIQLLKCLYSIKNSVAISFLYDLQKIAEQGNKIEQTLSGQKSKLIFREKMTELNALGIDACAKAITPANNSTICNYVQFFIENNKANVLHQQLQHLDARKLLPAAIAQKEKELSSTIQKLSYELSEGREINQSNLSEQTGEKLWSALQQYDAFSKSIFKKYPKYAQLLFNNNSVSLSTLQASLQSSQCFLNYFYANQKYYVLKIEKNEISFSKIASGFNIDSLLQEYAQSMQHKNEDIATGNLLYRIFLPDNLVKNHTELIISPDGPLFQLPFETLITDTFRFKPAYLLQQCSIYYTLSSAIFVSGCREKIADNSRLLAIAPDYTGSRLESLPYAQQEVNAVTTLIRGNVLSGQSASKQNFLQNASKYGFLHIAAHTILNSDNPDHASIYFCTDRKLDSLSVSEIYSLSLQARLAVLSSCQTFSGPLQQGEGILSLSRAFHYAGVKNMVASSWNAPDKSTAWIISDFYKNLIAGVSKSEALRLAKLHYIEQADAVGAQPYFWGGLILYGDQTPIVFTHNKIFIYVLSVLILFGITVLLYMFRNKIY